MSARRRFWIEQVAAASANGVGGSGPPGGGAGYEIELARSVGPSTRTSRALDSAARPPVPPPPRPPRLSPGRAATRGARRRRTRLLRSRFRVRRSDPLRNDVFAVGRHAPPRVEVPPRVHLPASVIAALCAAPPAATRTIRARRAFRPSGNTSVRRRRRSRSPSRRPSAIREPNAYSAPDASHASVCHPPADARTTRTPVLGRRRALRDAPPLGPSSSDASESLASLEKKASSASPGSSGAGIPPPSPSLPPPPRASLAARARETSTGQRSLGARPRVEPALPVAVVPPAVQRPARGHRRAVPLPERDEAHYSAGSTIRGTTRHSRGSRRPRAPRGGGDGGGPLGSG